MGQAGGGGGHLAGTCQGGAELAELAEGGWRVADATLAARANRLLRAGPAPALATWRKAVQGSHWGTRQLSYSRGQGGEG